MKKKSVLNKILFIFLLLVICAATAAYFIVPFDYNDKTLIIYQENEDESYRIVKVLTLSDKLILPTDYKGNPISTIDTEINLSKVNELVIADNYIFEDKLYFKSNDKLTSLTYNINSQLLASNFESDLSTVKELTINGYGKISNNELMAYQNCDNLNKLNLSVRIRAIEKDVFSACKNLEYVILPSICKVEERGFSNNTKLYIYDKSQIVNHPNNQLLSLTILNDKWVINQRSRDNIISVSEILMPFVEIKIEKEELLKFDEKFTAYGLNEGTTKVTVTALELTEVFEFDVVSNNLSGIEFIDDELEVMITADKELLIAPIPFYLDAGNYSLSTTDTNLISITNDHFVNGIEIGTAIVTATNEYGLSTSKEITVKPGPDNLIIDEKELTIMETSSKKVKHHVEPVDAYSKCYYSSSNEEIATVDNNGVVKGINVGKCIIYVTTGNDITEVVNVNVIAQPDSIKFESTSMNIKVGTTKNYVASISSKDSYNKITYTSSNENIVSIDENGKITINGKGQATITATAANGLTAKCKINAYNSRISCALIRVPLQPGKTFQLSCELDSINKDCKILYETFNSNICTVSETGKITAHNSGEAKIRVYTSDGEHSIIVYVSVRDSIVATGIDVSKFQGNISQDRWYQIKNDGVDFAILRMAVGGLNNKGGIDGQFAKYYEMARKAGIDIGVYHYIRGTTVEAVTKEAETLLFYLSLKPYKFEYPIFVDFEDPPQMNLSVEQQNELLQTYCDILFEKGYCVGIYSFANCLRHIDENIINRYSFNGQMPVVWVAHWGTLNPNSLYKGKYGVWQYTSSGVINGIWGRCDLDVATFDYPKFIKENHLNGY